MCILMQQLLHAVLQRRWNATSFMPKISLHDLAGATPATCRLEAQDRLVWDDKIHLASGRTWERGHT